MGNVQIRLIHSLKRGQVMGNVQIDSFTKEGSSDGVCPD